MSVTLAQAAELSQNELRRGVLETFVLESPLLDRIPFHDIEGNAYAYDKEGTLPKVQFRGVNEAWEEETGTVNQATETLTIMGGDADVDQFIQETRSNINDQRAVQDALKIKAASMKFQDAFINGNVEVDAHSFEGLKRRIVGGQVLARTNGIKILGNGTIEEMQAFVDFLEELMAKVPGLNKANGALFMPNSVRQKIVSCLRRLNVYTQPVNRLPEPLILSVSGGTGSVNEAELPTFNGIPMIDLGENLSGSPILPTNETQGTATSKCGSIYAVKFGDDPTSQSVTGLTNGGMKVKDLGELQVKPSLRTRIEMYVGVGVFGGKACARGAGVIPE